LARGRILFNSLASEIIKASAISSKDEALIAPACSVAVRCKHCVMRHKEIASKAGASEKEMREAAAIARLVRMGSGYNAAQALLDE
jgi:AhpD family alkylhydroperoxidase